MLSPVSSTCVSSPSSSCTVPGSTTDSSSESPCAYCSSPFEPPGSSSPAKTSRCRSGRGVSNIFRPRTPNASVCRSARRSTLVRGGASGWKRSEIEIPSPSAIRRSDAMLALARPRSTWLRKLSLRPARSATSRSVQRRALRISRRRSPTSISVAVSGALEGTAIPSDPVEEQLKRRYGTAEAKVKPSDDERLRPQRPLGEAVGGEGGEVERGLAADDELREMLADGRRLLEPVPGETRRVEEPRRLARLADERIPVRAHVLPGPPRGPDRQLGEHGHAPRRRLRDVLELPLPAAECDPCSLAMEVEARREVDRQRQLARQAAVVGREPHRAREPLDRQHDARQRADVARPDAGAADDRVGCDP